MGAPINQKNMEDAADYYKSGKKKDNEDDGPGVWETAKGLIGLGDDKEDAEKEAIKRKMDKFNKSKPYGL